MTRVWLPDPPETVASLQPLPDGIEADVRLDTFAGRSQAAYLDCLTWLYGSHDRTGRVVQA